MKSLALIIAALMATSASAEAPTLDLVTEIQREVNLKLQFQFERNKKDVWRTPPIHGKGDCEDFALLKRKLLIDRGWPEEDIFLIIVYKKQDNKRDYEGHVVLYLKSLHTVLDSSIDGNPKKNVRPEKYKEFLEKNNFTLFCVVKDFSNKTYQFASDRCV